jgi:putative transposase
VQQYVIHYNEVRLHSAIGYVAPHTVLAGKEKEVFAARDEKLEAAREARRVRRRQRAA